MSERAPLASPRYPAIRALRLDAWRVPVDETAERMLGSLHPVLGEFVPTRPRGAGATVPAQRSAPELPDWLRRAG